MIFCGEVKKNEVEGEVTMDNITSLEGDDQVTAGRKCQWKGDPTLGSV